MNTFSTPNDIDILMHYYVCSDLHPRHHAAAVIKSTMGMVRSNILQASEDGKTFRCTDRGNAWVKLILSVPYPRKVWVDERGNVIPD